MTGIRITGWGIALPDKVVTNDDMAASLDTSDAWIAERTGIRERRIGGTTSGLAIEAGQDALRCAGRTRGRHRPRGAGHDHARRHRPGHGTHRAERPRDQGRRLRHQRGLLGLRLRPGRSVAGLIAAGSGPILLIGSETLSRITDMDDRAIAIIVGDGAGAVVVEPVDGPGSC